MNWMYLWGKQKPQEWEMFIDVFLFSDTFMMLDKNDMKKKSELEKSKADFARVLEVFGDFFGIILSKWQKKEEKNT